MYRGFISHKYEYAVVRRRLFSYLYLGMPLDIVVRCPDNPGHLSMGGSKYELPSVRHRNS